MPLLDDLWKGLVRKEQARHTKVGSCLLACSIWWEGKAAGKQEMIRVDSQSDNCNIAIWNFLLQNPVFVRHQYMAFSLLYSYMFFFGPWCVMKNPFCSKMLYKGMVMTHCLGNHNKRERAISWSLTILAVSHNHAATSMLFWPYNCYWAGGTAFLACSITHVEIACVYRDRCQIVKCGDGPSCEQPLAHVRVRHGKDCIVMYCLGQSRWGKICCPGIASPAWLASWSRKTKVKHFVHAAQEVKTEQRKGRSFRFPSQTPMRLLLARPIDVREQLCSSVLPQGVQSIRMEFKIDSFEDAWGRIRISLHLCPGREWHWRCTTGGACKAVSPTANSIHAKEPLLAQNEFRL